MKVMKKGKEQVLEYFENKFKQKFPDKSPVYQLSEDDNGILHLIVSGYNFIGKGNISLGGNNLEIEGGLVVEITKK